VFTAPALLPGSGYQVTVTAPGFGEYDAKGLVLQVGQNLSLNISLEVGQTATNVEVTAAAQLVEDTKTDVSQVVVDNTDIMNLPINGRRVNSFVLNTPGVTNDSYFGLLSFRGVAGNNSFLLDGNDNTRIQTGGTVGGPIIKDKLFFFLSTDITRRNFPMSDSWVIVGIVNPTTETWVGCGLPARNAKRSTLCCPASTARSPARPTMISTSAAWIITYPTATLSAPASTSFAGFDGNSRVPFQPIDSLYVPPFYREALRLTKNIPIFERVKLALAFEAFNVANSWTPFTLSQQEHTEAKGILTLTPTAYGVGQADGGFPDGTQARRLQVSARISF
jgi:hypothetical protein